MSPWLLIEVLLYGVFWTYLIFVVPAAVVTALKGQWLFLTIGFFTLGLLWFIGAYGRAREGSWWSARFYRDDPEPGTREFERMNGRKVQRAAVCSMLAVLLVGLFAARPAPILGVDGKSLQYDVGGLISFEESCSRREDGDWICFRYDDAVSGDVSYRVLVDTFGCWKARPPRGQDRGPVRYTETELSGCLTVFSYLRPFDLII